MGIDFTNNRKLKAWTITLGIHLVLLVIFLIWKYDFPLHAHPVEEPIEVALGTDMDGLGDDPDQSMEAPAPDQSESSHDMVTSSNQQHIEASDDPDVVNPVKVHKTQPQVKANNKANNNPTNVKNTRTNNSKSNTNTTTPKSGKYVYQGSTGTGGNSAGEDKKGTGSGNTTGSGTQGSPGGSPDGQGRMTTTVNLKDRTITARPSPNAIYNEGGQVTVRVTVDRSGRIIKHTITSFSNTTLKNIVAQKIGSVRFNASSSAAPQQSGTIIFNFSTGKK